MVHTDICIAGAGVIGLSIALEFQACNLNVTVVEAGRPLREASWAAAGMLAAHDPHNPTELFALSKLSASLYPHYLGRLEDLGGIPVPFQTSRTLQSLASPGPQHNGVSVSRTLLHAPVTSQAFPPSSFYLLDEHSIDPRQLSTSLLAAIAATPIRLLTEAPVISTQSNSTTVLIATSTGTIEAAHFIDCTGAWAGNNEYQVVPIKGQMLAVGLPCTFQMKTTVRTADIYIVPRTLGPMAGRAIIGATVEDAGFDKTVHASQIADLHQQATTLLPELADVRVIDSWSGLRPATSDRLPILGAHPTRPRHWIATGHYRNGILLAPATAHVLTQLLLDQSVSVPLEDFSPSRHSIRSAVTR